MAAPTVALALAAAALLGVALLCLVLVLALRAERRRTAALLSALAERVEDVAPALAAPRATRPAAAVAEFVITDLGADDRPAVPPSDPPSARVVLDGALGEPLLRGIALAHGLRRALSAESRNRIRFEVRREVRRSRRRRKQQMRDAWRRTRAEDGSAA